MPRVLMSVVIAPDETPSKSGGNFDSTLPDRFLNWLLMERRLGRIPVCGLAVDVIGQESIKMQSISVLMNAESVRIV